MRNGAIIVVLALGLAAGVTGWFWFRPHPKPGPVNVAEYESDMTEALVRKLLEPLRTNDVSMCFLAFGERLTAPSPWFMARLSGVRPPLSDLGKAIFLPNGTILEGASGRRAALIQVVSVKKRNAGAFDVEAAVSGLTARPDRGIYTAFQTYEGWQFNRRKP